MVPSIPQTQAPPARYGTVPNKAGAEGLLGQCLTGMRRRREMKSAKLWMLVAIILGGGIAVLAQDQPNTENGMKAFGSYHGGNLDSVSLTSGNLNLRIPLISYPQRGSDLSLDFFIRYNNKGYVGVQIGAPNLPVWKWLWQGNGAEVVRSGVLGLQDISQSVPVQNCPGGPEACLPVLVQMSNAISPDGGSHLMGGICSDTCPTGVNFGDAIALDASGIRYLAPPFVPQSCAPPLQLVEPNGVRHFEKLRSEFTVDTCNVATPGYWT